MKKTRARTGRHRAVRGFTVFELLVTIGVFALLSVAAIANFRAVDNSLILRNVANQVALVIRKAQIYGISVAGIQAGGNTIFPSYGINFDTSRNTSFMLFADLDPDGTGPIQPDDVFNGVLVCPGNVLLLQECRQKYNLANGYTIADLCGGVTCSLDRLNITFTRPNPDTVIKENAGPGGYPNGRVIIQSKSGDRRTIRIWKTGQISIE